ncbi:MAG: glutamine amidotransferase [bacterium]
MRPLIVQTGTPAATLLAQRGDYAQLFADGFGWPRARFAVLDAHAGAALPEATSVEGILVTGSPLSVHDRPAWSVRLGEWLVEAVQAGVPVLGICYGHQLLGDALGGAVGPNPAGREIGVLEVEVEPDPLFAGLPARFPVVLTHSDAVNAAPRGVRVLASTPQTPVQAMAIGPRCRTLQWHPEFDAPAIRQIIRDRAAALDQERGEGAAAALEASIVGVHTGPVILRNFLENFLLA